ncbi:MAG: AAA family ATPase [Granulosicoccaceae bacterium]
MKTVNYMQPGAALQGYATVPATSDAKEYLRLLLRHKFGLLLTFLLGLGLAMLYLISTLPEYEANALISVDNTRKNRGEESEALPNWNQASVLKEESSILSSRRVLQPVVEQHNLRTQVDAKKIPVLGDLAQRLPLLGGWISNLSFVKGYAWQESAVDIAILDAPREWEDEELTLTSLGDSRYSLHNKELSVIDSARVGESIVVESPPLASLRIQVTSIDAAPGVEFTVIRHSLENSIIDLRSRMFTESSDARSQMINVRVRGSNPEQAANLTNGIISQYRDVKLGYSSRDVDDNLEFFEEEVPRLEQELRAAEAALSVFRTKSQTANLDIEIKAALGRLDLLERKLLELQIERDELAERYTNLHPSTKRLDKEITVLRRKISQSKAIIRAAPDTQRELTVLEQKVESASKIYNDRNEELIKLRGSARGTVGAVEIWDEAQIPRKPISPNSLLAIVGGTLATLFCYMLFLTLRSALTTVISDQDSLERASGLPVFMNIPKSAAQKRLGNALTVDPRRMLPGSSGGSSENNDVANSNVLALSKPEDYSVENLRGLRSMLEDVMDNAANNVLMITSPLPSMGKSFVSMNLAVLLAQSGKRVLLIDADYQRGQLHKSFGMPMGPGLPEVVRGKSELKETVKATSVPNLYCIPRGFMGGTAGQEMPSDKEFGAFMQVVAPRFDIAIIDTPPVLSVATAAALGKHAGSTLMVVKEGEVKEPQLTESLKRLSFSGVRVNGCIMNGSTAPTPRHYAYYREQLD